MPPFSAEDATLVRETFRSAAAAPETFAAAYFRRLFELDRSLRRLFHGDMRQLGQKLVSTLGVLVNNLDAFSEFAPHMRALGARHAGYQVRDEYYAIAGIALIGALAGQLGERFTPEARTAWTRVLGAITDEIVAGSRSVAAPHAPRPESSALPFGVPSRGTA